jgi:hypothetical protein
MSISHLHEAEVRIRELEAHAEDVEKSSLQANARIRELEAALKEAELQRDSWKHIAESGLGIPQTETKAESNQACEWQYSPYANAIADCKNCKRPIGEHKMATENRGGGE